MKKLAAGQSKDVLRLFRFQRRNDSCHTFMGNLLLTQGGAGLTNFLGLRRCWEDITNRGDCSSIFGGLLLPLTDISWGKALPCGSCSLTGPFREWDQEILRAIMSLQSTPVPIFS